MTEKDWYTALSPERKAIEQKRRRDKYNSASKEEKLERSQKRKEREQKYFNSLSPEKKQEFIVKRTKRWKDFRQKYEQQMSEATKEKQYRKQLEKNMKTYYALSPEGRKERLEKMKEDGKIRRQEKRKLVMCYYCQGEPHCMSSTCEVPGGAKHPDSLCIDHVNGGGRTHAKEVGGHVIDWIIKNDFPEGLFQVLCQNCNIRKKIANKEDYKHHKDWRTK